MKIPQIKLETTKANLSLSTTQSIQKIEQPQAELSIEQLPAELDIQRTPGMLSIDQSQARADMDLKSVSRRIEDFAQQGYSDWMSGLERLAAQGDELMMIENGGEAIPMQAKENSETPLYDFNVAFIPSPNSVRINYETGRVDLNWKVNAPQIEVKTNRPIHQYTPGTVKGEMTQWPSLSIGVQLNEKK